ncbi:MAG: epoxyqueuosine reductase [Chloroflexota bacterium]
MEKKRNLTPAEAADLVIKEIKTFVRTSPRNLMPGEDNYRMFDEPMVAFADGDDPLFTGYKEIIDPAHFTPRETLGKTYNKTPGELPSRISVISYILPITEKTRISNRSETKAPSRRWSYTRNYGEPFNEELRKYIVGILRGMGYLAVAPGIEPYFTRIHRGGKSPFSNWSERHAAFAAGLGTFSLSDGFITERGIAHRCGSIVTDMTLPVSQRMAKTPYENCLFYVDKSCDACIARCPCKAITQSGHNKPRCETYQRGDLNYLFKEYEVTAQGCGLCQTDVPCESRNPVK